MIEMLSIIGRILIALQLCDSSNQADTVPFAGSAKATSHQWLDKCQVWVDFQWFLIQSSNIRKKLCHMQPIDWRQFRVLEGQR